MKNYGYENNGAIILSLSNENLIAENNLPNIHIPVMVIQGNNDPVVNSESGKDVFDLLKSEKKSYITINTDKHVIIRGEEQNKVFPYIIKFLLQFLK